RIFLPRGRPGPRDAPLLAFYRWLAHYYHHPLGEVLQTAIPDPPRGQAPAQERWVELSPDVDPGAIPARTGSKAAAIVALLAQQGSCPFRELAREIPQPQAVLRRLVQQGYVVLSARPRPRAVPIPPPLDSLADSMVLSNAQEQAVQAIGQALARHFAAEMCRRHGVQRTLSSAVLQRFHAYDWPGNVRELENMVERLIVLAESKVVTEADLPSHLLGTEATPVLPPVGSVSLPALLDAYERRILEEARKRARSTMQLAKLLGISQPTVVRKLRKHFGNAASRSGQSD
ncbi:MAG: hypothetical protein K6T68_08975, partial [Alicyclobacillus shizuokensis]|nr:hypothetical protein [Alicyclobacillus shizuokensis]